MTTAENFDFDYEEGSPPWRIYDHVPTVKKLPLEQEANMAIQLAALNALTNGTLEALEAGDDSQTREGIVQLAVNAATTVQLLFATHATYREFFRKQGGLGGNSNNA